MVQFINLPQSTPARLTEQLGTALGQGVAKNLPKPEVLAQRLDITLGESIVILYELKKEN